MISVIRSGGLSQTGRVSVAGFLLALLAAVTVVQASTSGGPDQVLGASSGTSAAVTTQAQAQENYVSIMKASAAMRAQLMTTKKTAKKAPSRAS